MGGGGEARASICRAAGWPGHACPGLESRRNSRRGSGAAVVRRGGGGADEGGPGVSGATAERKTRRWLAGLLARSERGVREERAQERGSAGVGPAGPRGERNGLAGAKLLGRGKRKKRSWAGLAWVRFGFEFGVFFSYFLSLFYF